MDGTELQVTDDGDRAISFETISITDTGDKGEVCIIDKHNSVNCCENARLIAAAPDLLEALQNLENDDGSIPSHAWDMVQAAIAKAGGVL